MFILIFYFLNIYKNIREATNDIIDKSYGKGCEDESFKLKSTFALKNHQHNTDEIIYNNEILTNILKNILNKI